MNEFSRLTDAEVRTIALAHGFKYKEQPDGTMDLNPYVYSFARELIETATALAAAPIPPAQHSDDEAVDRFGEAMKAKLAEKRKQGYGGWNDEAVCSIEFLQKRLVDHIEKGDPVDVGNFAMMLHQRRAATKPPEQEAGPVAEVTSYREIDLTATIRFFPILNGRCPFDIGAKLYTHPQFDAQEVEPIHQFQLPTGFWVDFHPRPDSGVGAYPQRTLYTRPQSDKLRQAAREISAWKHFEGNIDTLLPLIADLEEALEEK
jgi:hypothetical protein